MISRQKQIYELRKAVISELKLRTVRERMAATLRNKGQVASGNLESVIAKMKYEKSVRVSNTAFDPETGLMYRATVSFEFDFTGAGYAKYLDIVYYGDIQHVSNKSGIKALMDWIMNKPIRTFKNPVNIVEARQNEKKRRRMAHAIMNSQRQQGGVKNKSNFITFSRSNVTTAINKATARFVDYLSDELYLEIQRQILFK